MNLTNHVYIITNAHHTVLYVGVTSNLKKRINQHKNKYYRKSFSAKYNVNKLVYMEAFGRIIDAIKREKYIKGKSRKFKIDLVNSANPKWLALKIER
jgi:putative endonuclease